MRCARCAALLPDDSLFCHRCGAGVDEALPAAPPIESGVPLTELLQRELGGEIAIERELERTQSLVTFLGAEIHSQRTVAVRVVPPEWRRDHVVSTEHLLSAARSAVGLKHPRLAPVHRVAAGDRLCWYVTAFTGGTTLEALLQREQLSVDRVIELACQIAAALSYAHERGIVQGAVMPSSIMIDDRGAAMIAECGILRAVSESTPGGVASLPGMAAYAAPELAEGIATPASDQYALGVLTRQLLAGSHTDVPATVTKAIGRATASRPEDRFPDVGRFAAALRQTTRSSATVVGTPAPAAPAAARPSESVLKVPAGKLPAPAKPARKVKLGDWVKGAVALAATVLVAALFFFVKPSDDRPPVAGAVGRPDDSRIVGVTPEPPQERTAAQVLPPFDSLPTRASSSDARSPEQPAPRAPDRRKPPAARRTAPPRRDQPAADPSTPAWVTLGTLPQSAITINGQQMPTNPVRNFQVRPGSVSLHFEVTDASGTWHSDMVVSVAPGDTLNLHRVQLVHP